MKRAFLMVLIAWLSLTLPAAGGRQEGPAPPSIPAEPEKTAGIPQMVQAPPGSEKHESEQPASNSKATAQAGDQKVNPAQPFSTSRLLADLKRALTGYLTREGDDPATADPHQTALIDLNGDGLKDALVLLKNSYWCGSGGCTMLVFQGAPSGFEFVSPHPLVHRPVIVCANKTHQWRDLVVNSSGGGLTPSQIIFKFTGTGYSLDSSALPGLPPDQPVKGIKAF